MNTNLLNVGELAEKLKLHKTTIYGWTSNRTIPFIKFGGKLVRFDLSEVKKWLKMKQIPMDKKALQKTFSRRILKKVTLRKRGEVWCIDFYYPYGRIVRAISTKRPEAQKIATQIKKNLTEVNTERWDDLLKKYPDLIDVVTFGGLSKNKILGQELFKEEERVNLKI